MRTLLRRIDHLMTFDDEDRELADADVLIEGPMVVEVGVGLDRQFDGTLDRVIDGRNLVVTPGLVNAHQHLYQGAVRALPGLERTRIGPWLDGVGRHCLDAWRRGRFGAGTVEAVAKAVLTESLLGGVTTVADQHYFFPSVAGRDNTEPFIEATIAAAGAIGIRLHACRGSITLGRSDGGAAPDETVQSVDEVVRHSAELVERYHDDEPTARVRVALAPCGVHTDQPHLFDELAALASDFDSVRLHTHLYERVDTAFAAERYGTTPWQFLVDHGWATGRTWLAHVVDPPLEELADMASAGVGVAHLPVPDLKMGWGTAPLREMLDAGITVGFGTTGSASNDGANLLGDLRVAALVHRDDNVDPPSWPSARELLRAATRGSADCLGRPELGRIATGAAADIVGWDRSVVDRVGVHDPVIGLLHTGLSATAALVMINGTILVEHGQPTSLEPDVIADAANRALGAAVSVRRSG